MTSSEILVNGEFQPGPELPVGTYDHCMVAVNATHVFMSGGSTEAGLTHNTFIYDRDNEKWHQMPEALWDKEVTKRERGQKLCFSFCFYI